MLTFPFRRKTMQIVAQLERAAAELEQLSAASNDEADALYARANAALAESARAARVGQKLRELVK